MSTADQRAMWAFETEHRAAKARRAELEGLYAAVAQLEREIAEWRDLAIGLIQNGATLPKT